MVRFFVTPGWKMAAFEVMLWRGIRSNRQVLLHLTCQVGEHY